MNTTIRSAALEDLPAILQIERGCETAPHWRPAAYEEILRGLEEDVERCLLVAEVDGQVVGFAVGRVVAGAGELESVVVETGTRRSGVGSALCTGVLAWCRERGAECVELEVRAGSFGPIRMYQRFGFKQVGIRPRYYAAPIEDAVLMQLSFEQSRDD